MAALGSTCCSWLTETVVAIMSFNLLAPERRRRTLGKTCIFAAVGTCQLIDVGLKNTRVPDQSTVSICRGQRNIGAEDTK